MNPKTMTLKERLLQKYPTTISVLVVYLVFVALNVSLVMYEWYSFERSRAATGAHYYDDLGIFVFLLLLLVFFGAQAICFFVGAMVSFFVDRHRLKNAALQTDGQGKRRLISIGIITIFLLLPASWLYSLPFWSLFHEIRFQAIETPQVKLTREFAQNALNSGYDCKKIDAYLNKGADVNVLGYRGTPLIMATRAEDKEYVNKLLARGANVDATDGQQKTALAYALEDAPKQPRFRALRKEIALTLIEHGADPKVGDYYNPLNTAIHAKRDKELIQKLLARGEKLSPQKKEQFLSDALMAAAYSGYDYAVLELLDRGANINYRADLNCPLTNAIESHNYKTACLLISHGANVNVEDQNGASPLMLAAQWQSPELLCVLLKAGASVTAKDKRGNTVLSYAARTGDVERTKKMISLGAPIDVDGIAGKEALAAAIDANSPELVKLFIDAGVNVNGAFYGGNGTLLKKATVYNPRTRPEIIRLLREAGARE